MCLASNKKVWGHMRTELSWVAGHVKSPIKALSPSDVVSGRASSVAVYMHFLSWMVRKGQLLKTRLLAAPCQSAPSPVTAPERSNGFAKNFILTVSWLLVTTFRFRLQPGNNDGQFTDTLVYGCARSECRLRRSVNVYGGGEVPQYGCTQTSSTQYVFN